MRPLAPEKFPASKKRFGGQHLVRQTYLHHVLMFCTSEEKDEQASFFFGDISENKPSPVWEVALGCLLDSLGCSHQQHAAAD